MRLLFVHAHPDDETLWNGVTIAHHAAAGDEVHVLTCTLGEEGEIIPPELAHLTPEELAEVRRGELSAALATLGATGRVLPFRDSGMAGSVAAAHPQALVGNLERATDAAATVIEELDPDVVVTYEASGGYGHPDHIAVHRITMAAAGGRPVWQTVVPRSWALADRSWLQGRSFAPDITAPPADAPLLPSVVDDHSVTHRVVDAAAGDVRAAALGCHRTQVSVYEDYYALSNDIAARLTAREAFVEVAP